MKRILAATLIVFSMLLAGLLAVLYYLGNTEQGLRQAVSLAQRWLADNTNQTLQVNGLQGTIWNGLFIESLSWQDGERFVEIGQLKMVLNSADLFERNLVVEDLSAKVVNLQIPPTDDPEPFTLPDRIPHVLNINLQSLQIDRVVFNALDFRAVQGKAYLENGQLTINSLAFNTQDTQVNSSAGLTLEKPYLINGEVKANRNFDDVLLNADLTVKGSIERLELNLTALGSRAATDEVVQRAQASAVVTPFNPTLLEQVELHSDRFDPSWWFEGAPRATLNVNATIQPNDDFSQSTGTLSATNAAPSSWHDGGLPVSQLRARFELALKAQQLEQIDAWIEELNLADGKRAAGSAAAVMQWQAPAAPKDGARGTDFMAGDIRYSIQTRDLDASVFAKLPQRIELNSTIEGNKVADIWRVSDFSVRDREATLKGRLTAGLAGKVPIDMQVELADINPGKYIPDSGRFLQGRLNGSASFKGNLAPSGNRQQIDPAGELALNLDNSTLANAPLVLKAQAVGGLSRLSHVLLDLNVVGNTAFAKGSYGTSTDFVDVDVNLDELDRLGRLIGMNLDGTARLRGKLRGLQGNFSGDGVVEVHQFAFDNTLQVERISGQFALGSAPGSPWTGDIQVSKLKTSAASVNAINDMKLTLRGVRSQHELQGVFSSGLQPFSRQRPLKGEFALSGGILPFKKQKKTNAWQGAITALKLEGIWQPARSFALQSPAPLTLASGHVELLDVVLKGEDTSTIRNRVLRMSNREIEIQGDMPQFVFPRLSPILRKQITVEPKDLVANVEWKYLANPLRVEGHLDIAHVSGGLQILEDSQVDVGIRTMIARIDFNREAVSLNLNVVADKFGVVNADLRVPVEQNPSNKSWGIAGNKPMQGTVAAGFTELNWLGPMISGGVRTSGTGQVAMAIGGTANKPDVQGRLFGMGVNVFQLDQGVRLEDGNVVVDFTTDKASIDTFEFTVYNRRPPRRYLEQLGPLIQGNGKVAASGQWNLAGRDGEIRLVMDKVPLLQRPDRWMKVDSQVVVQQPSIEGDPLKIRGELDVLGAYFEMPESGPQTLGDDVFIQGRSELAGPGLPIDLQVRANLGELFFVNAEGLRSRLQGGVRLVMLEGVGGSGQRRSGRRLTATGTIQTVDGTYRAYGQDLSIERGVVNFQGPLDNPGLNIRAVRKGAAVEAGVEVTGTAQRPRVTLVSEPAVPDSEKLSWMILGRGSGSADRDSTLLLTAAAAIFGNDDESTTRKIAKSIGIDELNLSTGSLTAADSRAVGSKVAIAPGADASASVVGSDDPLLSQRIVSLGKRLSDRFYLSFDQSVTTAASILKLNYQYSRQLSFIARSGADNAVDVLYQLSFD